MTIINIDQWYRKEAFRNFLEFDDPFFNITADVRVTKLLDFVKRSKGSYFLASFYTLMHAVNQVENLRYRIRGDQVVLHDQIDGGTTILRADQNFGYAYFEHGHDYDSFQRMASLEIEAVKAANSTDPQYGRDDLFHSSIIPWVSFSGFEHAKRLNKGDSIPKFVMGKIKSIGEDAFMPVSAAAHHSLVDGLHIGQFFQTFEALCQQPEQLLQTP